MHQKGDDDAESIQRTEEMTLGPRARSIIIVRSSRDTATSAPPFSHPISNFARPLARAQRSALASDSTFITLGVYCTGRTASIRRKFRVGNTGTIGNGEAHPIVPKASHSVYSWGYTLSQLSLTTSEPLYHGAGSDFESLRQPELPCRTAKDGKFS